MSAPDTQQDIVDNLRTRALIRRKIDRGDGKPDRIADVCEQAANEIEELRERVNLLELQLSCNRYQTVI